MPTITIQPSLSTYTLQIPQSDQSFFRSLAKKMGWTIKRNKTVSIIPSETLEAVNEARSGMDAGKVDTSSLQAFIDSME